MRELSKFCRIYCHNNHKKRAELLPHTEKWINSTVASGTGYTPTELMYGAKRPNVFDEVMPKVQGLEQEEEDIAAKLEAAYAKKKQKAAARERRRKKGNAVYVFWVFPRRQIVVGRRFGTPCQFHLQRLDVDTVYIQPLKMKLTQGSETSANYNLTPGKHPKEHIQYSNHGESLKSRKEMLFVRPN